MINKFGYFGIFLLIMIENLFPPIPSEIILTFSGFVAEEAKLSLVLIIISSTLGSVVGALILYYLGYFLNDKITSFNLTPSKQKENIINYQVYKEN